MTASPSPLEIAQIALERGDLCGARSALEALADAAPSDQVTFQLARLERLSGAPETALAHLDPLLERNPKALAIWLERAIVARALGRPLSAAPVPELIAISRGQAPQLPEAGGRWGKTLRQVQAARKKGNLRAAMTGLGAVPKDAPVAVLAAYGDLLLATGQAAQAKAIAQHIQRAHPLVAIPFVLFARAQVALGAVRQAVVPAVQAAEITPKDAAAVRLALQALLEIDAVARARILWAMPGVPQSKLPMEEARLLLAEGRPASATAKADGKAKTAGDYEILARAFSGAGQTEAALAAYDQSLALRPNPDLAVARAQLMQSSGASAEAEAALRDILKEHPSNGLAARALASGKKLSADDPAVQLMEQAGEDRHMLFARAKVAEDNGAYGAVFPLLDRANALAAKLMPYDPAKDDADLAELVGPVTATLREVQAEGSSALSPIFVTGAPRSGTTLVERILGAHGDVAIGGELGVFRPAVEAVMRDLSAERVPDGAALDAAAGQYESLVEERMGAVADRFTDKSIHTFAHMGVVAKVMPRAKIVVVHRDLRDVALSIYRNQFSDGMHRYNTSLEGIAHYFAMFRKFVAHWKSEGVAFHEIHYEQLLADPEGETRALLDAVDLSWDPACLEFHTSKARIDTLSFAQARQPIYQSSKGGWRRYETELKPFIDACAREGLQLD